ncbi:MAG: tRNA threonylcarbamoyladenosine dehydratase [Firmicutes bacterium]|nr:tRNA threonylcarbamoyladenosine dehydratase [Bacillota bacterium]
MLNQFSRSEIILGKESVAKLARSRVAIFGIGGVGGFSVEALVRAGVGTLGLFDDDKICLTNLNRQLHATMKTVGLYKTDVAEARIKEINPVVKVKKHNLFYSAETSSSVDLSQYDYIIDAIDTVSCKIELILRAKERGVPIISCMAAGNRLDPTAFEIADIYKTSMCPLSKVMRHELKKRGVESLKVVYSKEPSISPVEDMQSSCKANCICPPDTARKCTVRRQIPGSVAFVPSVAGLIMAGEVIKDLLM